MDQEQLTKTGGKSADPKYSRFLADEGWKYQNEEQREAGYARQVKAERGDPLTWEEFLEELRIEGDITIAQELYRVLCRHMESGVLSAYDLYQYAKHRWCVNRPEAVIACQIGPKHWAVNNCDEVISGERAALLLNKEFYFEASRIELLSTPYYESTDWNFIHFRCGPYHWLMHDGELDQIYQ